MSEPKILYMESDAKGRPYVIEEDSHNTIDTIIERLEELLKIGVPQKTEGEAPEGAEATEDDEKDYCDDELSLDYYEYPWTEEHPTKEQAEKEQDEIRAIIKRLREDLPALLQELHAKIPRKQNGTFYKNRVTPIWETGTFTNYWEDSYAWVGPAVYIKTLSDFRAVIDYDWSRALFKR